MLLSAFKISLRSKYDIPNIKRFAQPIRGFGQPNRICSEMMR